MKFKSKVLLLVVVALMVSMVLAVSGCGDQATSPVMVNGCADCNVSQELLTVEVVTPEVFIVETIGDRVPNDPGEDWTMFPSPLQPPGCEYSFYYTIDEDNLKGRIYGPSGCASSSEIQRLFDYVIYIIGGGEPYMEEYSPPI